MDKTLYQKTTLTNGIRIVTERIPHVRSISIGAWFVVGSRDENAQNNGISHFVEHMLFKGTESRSTAEIAECLESVGGHVNAFTSKELTCYYAHILDEHLPIAVDLLSDIVMNSVFAEKEIEKERKVILEEISAMEETPEEMVHEYFLENLFPENPLGYKVIGERENIAGFQRTDTLAFVNNMYTANRLVIAACGNVDHRSLVELIEKNLKRLPKAAGASYEKPIPVGNRNDVVVENGAIQAHVCIGTQSYQYADSRKFPLLVLNTVLGSGMSSRLFQNIREYYGLAYSIYSFLDFFFDTGLLGIYVGTDKQNVDLSIELIKKELQKFRDDSLTPQELEKTKLQLKGNLMLGLESTASRMNRLAKMEIYLDNYFSLDQTIAEIEKVSAQDVHNVACELFDEASLHTTILRPKSD
jgi:predicted Zn-dependent peptidase